MRGLLGMDPGWGITVVRVAMALIFISAGYTKVFVSGADGVAEHMAKFGLPAPAAFAWTAMVLELGGGIALLLGFFGRWLGLLYTIQFVIAFFFVKLRTAGFAAGWLDLLLLATGLLLFLAGPGRAAVDSLWLEKAVTPRYVKRTRTA